MRRPSGGPVHDLASGPHHGGCDPTGCGATLTDWGLPVLLVLVLGGAYLAAVRARRKAPRSWSAWRTASFVSGAVMLGVATSPVVERLAHGDARGHMAQHLLLGMFAPLALVLGAPVTLLLGALPPAARRGVGAVLRSRLLHCMGHPGTAALLSVGSLYALYLTPLYLLSTERTVVHHLVHGHFVVAGYLFAWSVAGPDPAPRRPGMPVRTGVLVLAAAAHGYLAKLLYARAPDLPPGNAHGVAEMRQAAEWMYYGGDVAEVLLATALFAGWYRLRRRPVRVGGDVRTP